MRKERQSTLGIVLGRDWNMPTALPSQFAAFLAVEVFPEMRPLDTDPAEALRTKAVRHARSQMTVTYQYTQASDTDSPVSV